MDDQTLDRDEHLREELETLRDIALAEGQIEQGQGIPDAKARRILLSALDP